MSSEDVFIVQGQQRSYGIFITVPQITMTLDEAKEGLIKADEIIKRAYPQLGRVLAGCCIENHSQSDGQHVHMILHYGIRWQLKRQFMHELDEIFNKHGNYQMIKKIHAAERYIMKDGQYWFNYDVQQRLEAVNKHQKQICSERNTEIISRLRKGDLTVFDEGLIAPQNIMASIRGIQLLNGLTEPTWDIGLKEVWFIWGKSRTGKSTYARQVIGGEECDYYIKSAKNHWWDGYKNQTTVIIEDLPAKSAYQIYNLKMWLDTIHYQVEIKGGSVWNNAQKIVITSNHCLIDCLKDEKGIMDEEDYDAIYNRIHHIWRATNIRFDYKNMNSFSYEIEK